MLEPAERLLDDGCACRYPHVPCHQMATYEYICLACEHPFEERRPIAEGGVDTTLACPSCGDDRVRRRFSVFGTTGTSAGSVPSSGGCCGGGCACGG